MPTVDDWISYLEMLQRQLGAKKCSIIVKGVIQLLKASPKDLPSRESWISWLRNIKSEDTEVDLDALLNLLRGCPKHVSVRMPLHPTR